MNVQGGASGQHKRVERPKLAFGDRRATKQTGSDVLLDPEEYIVRKRIPAKWPRRNIDVYVTRKTHFAAQVSRCQKLLDSGEREVFIHGLGAAVTRAIHLALQLKRKQEGSVEVDVNTSTVPLVDDLLPEEDHVHPGTRSRANSAVHIRIFRPDIPASVST